MPSPHTDQGLQTDTNIAAESHAVKAGARLATPMTQSNTLEGFNLTAPKEGVDSLRKLGVDHWHDDEWEYTHDAGDLDVLQDTFSDKGFGEIIPIQTLIKGPRLYACYAVLTRDEHGSPDETELRFYSSEEDAKRAFSQITGEQA